MGGMIYFNDVLQNGKVLSYLDRHRKEKGVMRATYYIGQGYYLMQNLQEATTYFLRVAQNYPQHPLAEKSYFSYLQCLQDTPGVSREILIEGYQAYLEKYPEGQHAKVAQDRIDLYRTGAR